MVKKKYKKYYAKFFGHLKGNIIWTENFAKLILYSSIDIRGVRHQFLNKSFLYNRYSDEKTLAH
jgi:hypothetical protein